MTGESFSYLLFYLFFLPFSSLHAGFIVCPSSRTEILRNERSVSCRPSPFDSHFETIYCASSSRVLHFDDIFVTTCSALEPSNHLSQSLVYLGLFVQNAELVILLHVQSRTFSELRLPQSRELALVMRVRELQHHNLIPWLNDDGSTSKACCLSLVRSCTWFVRSRCTLHRRIDCR